MRSIGLVLMLAVTGCGSDGGGVSADAGADDAQVGDPTDAVFDPAHVVEVDITMAAADWDLIRNQGRDLSALASCQDAPAVNLYDTVEATVTIDGTTLDRVGVRKKGFLGSVSTTRPSLKLDFNEFIATQEYSGLSRLTLNNNRQDPSRLRTCMAYKVFAAAGVPTPRCNYARVSVNGQDLGVYSNVEAIKKPFLRRHFADDSGNLYEGQLSDFRLGFTGSLEKKTNTSSADRSDIDALVAALELPDNELLAALEPIVDVDSFITYWAVEALVGHWDGYSNNKNNFYLYADPSTGKFRFLPWGPDIGYTDNDPFSGSTRPVSVSAAARLPRRLYGLADMKAAYVARMRTLLADVWDEAALRAEVTRVDTMLAGMPDDGGLAEINDFIDGRRAAIEAELDVGGATWPYPEADRACWRQGQATIGTFSTTWDSLSSPTPTTQGAAQLELWLEGVQVQFTAVGVVAGDNGAGPMIRFVGRQGTEWIAVQFTIDDPLYQDGANVPYHGFATFGAIVRGPSIASLNLAGFIAGGSIELTSAGTTAGAQVRGQFSGTVYLPPNP